nr:zinc finger, CCHC-type, retrotransposon Gag domain protein [Tanacetum cinerariifolium]
QEDEYIQTRSNPEWYTKSGSTKAVRKTTWFDIFLKSNIDQNENHILRPSTITIAKNLKAIIQKDELTIAYLEGARLERLKQQYQNDVELEYLIDQLKAAMLSEAKWNRIDQRIPFLMSETYKGVVYLKQHNIKSFMKLSEVKKFCDGTLNKTQENLIDMVTKNKLGIGNKRLKGRDWTDIDVEKLNEMVDKIDKIRTEIREEFRTSSGPSDAGGNPPPVTIHTWLERFNKQKPYSFEKATAPVDAKNWISHMEKIFDVMGCED